ncbi:XkdQ/YqbQ family protein [Aneurinibacillus migulanus]|uniref:YqbQ/XkdQ domain-containing protein n=1 Tax=Aneurinibacillus migulanus TaxID=47500 RepID=A0A0D1XPC1_ANEMI|nr:hypothetical protein [Aneurinibacillus migulanus]KIV56221.1 hypothetical protein TS65_13465 [Aneurinibacillus migulanus]KON84287.1 hypothetical protein AF333_30610 [Aneurinibacillus migulanus]MED0893837.1 hypothetical protein [Aneurinibacillus migulanus]MED1614516.1 hypothetical protein [Aneurinibacillus migulanus]SDI84303.1 hypothetical protein SAMN04487909_108138 [Aneurinibacillus migulanus]
MAHQLFLIHEGVQTELTSIVGQITWSDSVEELGQRLDFTLPIASGTPYIKFSIAPSDIVTLINDSKVVFMGYIFEMIFTERTREVTCYDPLFYLNKSRTTIQFKGKETATACVKKLLAPFKIPTARIADMKTKIKKIYNEQTYSEILNDILYQARREIGEDYRFQMENGKLVIDRQNAFLLDVSVKLAANSGKFDLLEFISNPQRTVSITEMRNSIVITKDDQVYTSTADAGSVGKYGLLQETIAFDGNTLSDAKRQALSALRELNRINEEATFDILGHDEVRSGRVLKVSEGKTGIIGQFIITSTNHTLVNRIHKVNITLKRY